MARAAAAIGLEIGDEPLRMNVRKHSNLHPLSLAQRSTILDVVYDIFDNDLGQLSHKLAKLGIFFFQRLDVRFPNVLS
jgi:hypothetical protein